MKDYKDILDFIVKSDTKKFCADVDKLCKRIDEECEEGEKEVRFITNNYTADDIIGKIE